MTLNMLRAVSKMLDIKDTDEPQVFKTKVVCAKTMLDEIIEGFTPTTTLTNKSLEQEPAKKPAPKAESKYRMVVDDINKTITKIEGLALDAKVKYNDKEMTHQELIGKPFNSESKLVIL